jgi:hypothetical protein
MVFTILNSSVQKSPGAAPAGEPLSRTVQTSGPFSRAQKRKRIVSLLRGYFACPVIAVLGELGLADRMLSGPFSAQSFEDISDRALLSRLFRYLESIGLLVQNTASEYEATSMGRTVIARNGACSLLMSYGDYFQQLPAMLTGQGAGPLVNRPRNVRGSGQLHSSKFFTSALRWFDTKPPGAFIDIGCGDGCFLAQACERWPRLLPFGVDLSEVAVDATRQRLRNFNPGGELATAGNGRDIHSWRQKVPAAIADNSGLVISMWFVGHEFSGGEEGTIVQFFTELARVFPQARVVLAEINRIAPAVLSCDHEASIMPEFLLFHELSGQGVLPWDSWQDILNRIPYTKREEQQFDEVSAPSGPKVPASFIWMLEPKKTNGDN